MDDFIDFVQQVKRANDIVDVIGSYLELRKSGTYYFARCPFHGEKTPSFSVNGDRQSYKCFGCGEGGDVVTFVMKYESCSFYEAVEILAKRANMKMPETHFQQVDKQYQQLKQKREVYFAICKDTAKFYYKNFYSEQGEVARNYMRQRGFTEDTLKKFGIGYSPNSYSLVKFLQSKNYQTDDCVRCGVLQTRADGTPFDALSGRVIVPIFNLSGKVIAFGGRGIDEKTIAYCKYKNTQETPIFNKRDNLFALNFVKEQKQQNQKLHLPYLVMVEGYMDVIAMFQAKFDRAVASMGTSLTENQAKLVSRFTNTVYICYDGDSAGQNATVKALDIFDKAGLDVKVMSIPDNMDPDEFIKAHGAEAFEKLTENALSMPDYKLKLLDDAFPINSTDAAKRNAAMPKYVKGAIKLLQQLDEVRREQYISIISVKTGYSQEFLQRRLAAEKETGGNAPTDNLTPVETTQELKAKYFVAASLLNNMPFAAITQKPYCETAFLSKLYDYILECNGSGNKPQFDMMYTVCSEATPEEFEKIESVEFSEQKQSVNEQYFNECIKIIDNELLRIERRQLLEELHKSPENTELLTKISDINKKING